MHDKRLAIARLSRLIAVGEYLFTAYGEYRCIWLPSPENRAASDVLLYHPTFDGIIWC